MRLRLQLAGCVLALGISAGLALPCAAQHAHYGSPHSHYAAPHSHYAAQKPANSAPRPQHQAPPQQNHQHQPQQQHQQAQPPPPHQQYPQGGQHGSAGHAQSNPDWNRPGGGAVHSDRPPSANVPPPRYNNLSPQEKQRVLNNNRQWQNLSPAQRQQVQERAQIWQKMTPAQRDHIRNDVLPRWKELPPDRKRAIQNRLGVLKNMPESARNEHLSDPNFTRGMSEEDKSTLRDLSHLHVGGAPDPQNE